MNDICKIAELVKILKKIIPKYLNQWWRYFNLVLQQESTIRGDKLIKFWSRSDWRWLTDRNIYMKPIFAHIFVLDWDIDLKFCVDTFWITTQRISWNLQNSWNPWLLRNHEISKTFWEFKTLRNRLEIPQFEGNCNSYLMVCFII